MVKWKEKSAGLRAEQKDAEGAKNREIAARLADFKEAQKNARTNAGKVQKEKQVTTKYDMLLSMPCTYTHTTFDINIALIL